MAIDRAVGAPVPDPSQLGLPDANLQAVVVVPARDEEARIDACLHALQLQERVSLTSFEVIVVLDGCRDRTAEIVQRISSRSPLPVIHVLTAAPPSGVGRARRYGMDVAWQRLMAVGRPDGLIASTDADTIVSADWLAAQLALAAGGAEAIGGLIELDDHEQRALHPEALAARELGAARRLELAVEESDHGGMAEHPHFAGASLGLTASAYQRCGGLPARAALEDEALADALRREGIAIHRSRSVRVTTSARVSGRAPRGLAKDLGRADWRARRSYRASDYPVERVLAAKRTTVALILPAREVASTIGPITRTAARLRDRGVLDEVLVIDAASCDGTESVARAAEVPVIQENSLLSEFGPARGKGDAMWRGLAATTSEVVAYADADTADFDAGFILGLIGPMLCHPEIQLVKGAFRRPFRNGDTVVAEGGGRVTELMARPLINLYAPELAVFDQPLAGEIAARRDLLERIPFCAGYGVEIAMLIDCWRECGLDALAQVDLGVRQNRHQSLRDLSAMAYSVLVAAQSRFIGDELADIAAVGSITLPPRPALPDLMETRRVTIEERPPLSELRDQPALQRDSGVAHRAAG